jgi:hypothetical protein
MRHELPHACCPASQLAEAGQGADDEDTVYLVLSCYCGDHGKNYRQGEWGVKERVKL